MTDQKQADLAAAEYVLGLTDSHTRKQLDKRFHEDAEFAAEVQHWQKAFSGIDAASAAVAPSSALWQQIEQAISLRPAAPKATAPRRALLWSGWALAAMMTGIVIFTTVITPETSHTLQPVAVLSGTQPNVQFVVSLDKAASVIKVSALNVTLPENNDLQLWMIKGSAPPQSLGLIGQRDSNTFRLPSGELDNQTVLAISLEPTGGSQQAGPSGPVLFHGKVSVL